MWFLRLLSIRSVCTRVTFEDPTSTSKKVWKEHLPKKSWAPTLGSQFLWWYFFKSWSRYFNDLFRFFQKYHNLVKKTSRKTMQKLVGSRKWGNESWYPSRGFMFFLFLLPDSLNKTQPLQMSDLFIAWFLRKHSNSLPQAQKAWAKVTCDTFFCVSEPGIFSKTWQGEKKQEGFEWNQPVSSEICNVSRFSNHLLRKLYLCCRNKRTNLW